MSFLNDVLLNIVNKLSISLQEEGCCPVTQIFRLSSLTDDDARIVSRRYECMYIVSHGKKDRAAKADPHGCVGSCNS